MGNTEKTIAMPIDYTRYPPNWHTEIRPRILARAGHCCEWCGAPNHAYIYRPRPKSSDWLPMPEGHLADAMALDGVKFTKVVLTIAHLDHDATNWNVTDDRLKAACQRCHLMYDLPRHIENRRYGRRHRDGQLKMEL
jgi:hypothetical protein